MPFKLLLEFMIILMHFFRWDVQVIMGNGCGYGGNDTYYYCYNFCVCALFV